MVMGLLLLSSTALAQEAPQSSAFIEQVQRTASAPGNEVDEEDVLMRLQEHMSAFGLERALSSELSRDGNRALISQSGEGNEAEANQRGSSHVAVIYQDGNNNTTVVDQFGEGNVFGAFFEGDDNVLNATQRGTNNTYIRTFMQSGFEDAVTQTGNRNHLEIMGDAEVPFSIDQHGEGMRMIIEHNP